MRQGDQIRLATAVSANSNRQWYLVSAEKEGITDRLSAVGNPVQYHLVTMPASTETFTVEGAAGEVVRGMPFSFKVTPKQASYRVTVKVNGVEKATKAAVANITIPAVTEDLTVTVDCAEIPGLGAAEDEGWVVVNVTPGSLATKMNQVGWPEKLKLVGSLNSSDFNTFQKNASRLKHLDLADVSVPGNQMPSYSFYTMQGSRPSLQTLIMPKNVTTVATQACIQCIYLKEVVLPPTLTKVGAYAFSSCIALQKMTINRAVPPSCDFNPFPKQSKTLYVPSGSENAYKGASYWSAFNVQAMQDPKTYYCVTVDNSKVSVYGTDVDLDHVGVSNAKTSVWLVLPNCQETRVLGNEKFNANLRLKVPFKVYDNGVDLFADKPSIAYELSWNERYKQGGIYKIYFDPSDNRDDELFAPQNHNIEIYFYYPVTFENVNGTQGVKASIVNLMPGQEWKNVEMWRFGAEGTPTLYKGDTDIRFSLSLPEGKKLSDYVVTVEQKIMSKSGPSPEYRSQEFEITPENGIYTISSLPGDTKVKISPADYVEEAVAPTLEELIEGSTEEITELSLDGELTEEVFEVLKENFEAVEVLDLSGIENTAIPDNAFSGMEHLQSVTLPSTVTEIGSGAFEGCSNIETLNLTGVTSIGEGAFDGCTSLTSIMLPSLGASNPSGAPMKSPAEEGGITAGSFRGLNPNCLIYVGSTDIPDAENLNIILSVDHSRVAASDIILDGNYPFNAPASFNLGDHTISFTADIPASLGGDVDSGWKGLILPFSPDKMEYGVEIPRREGSGISIVSFDNEDATELTRQTAIEPNRPYLANVCAPYASVPVTFIGSGNQENAEDEYDVPFTPVPEETVAAGKEFSLYGSFDGLTTLGVCYALNEDGSAFTRPSDASSLSVASFGAYLRPNHDVEVESLSVGTHPFWVYDPAAAGVNVGAMYRSTKINLVSETEGAAIYYTVDGSDPCVDGASRRVYEAPFAIEGDDMTVNAVAEYKGNLSDVAVLDFKLKKVDINYDLVKNWNWISHNAENSVPVADFATPEMGRILSQTQEVVRDVKFGLVGSLTELHSAEAYKVFMNEASAAASVKGVAFDPVTPVALHRGWNWIGCPVDDASLSISDLFAALNAEEGEMIVGLEGFEQADADGVWSGTLSSLVPGAGYMYYSNSDKEFTYTLAPTSANKKVAAETAGNIAGHWVVDIHRYPSVMPVTATLASAAGRFADVNEYAVAAFCGDECRGIGVAVNGVMMINVHGVAGDNISFRYITPDNEEIISETSMIFGDKPAGSIAAPCEISMNGTSALDNVKRGDFSISTGNGFVSLEGNCSKVVSVEVYDMSGARIAWITDAAAGNVKIDGLESGFCIIVVRTADSCSYTKVLVK